MTLLLLLGKRLRRPPLGRAVPRQATAGCPLAHAPEQVPGASDGGVQRRRGVALGLGELSGLGGAQGAQRHRRLGAGGALVGPGVEGEGGDDERYGISIH